MKPGPSYISKIIFMKTRLSEPPFSVIDRATELIISNGWETSPSYAREKAEKWGNGILSIIKNELSELASMGRFSKVTINSSSDYLIQGACFIEPKDSKETQSRKNNRLRFGEYFDVLQSLKPNQFEKLCGNVISLLGVEHPYITRDVADEGIDFYGRLNMESIFFPQDIFPTIQKQLSIWLVGQAKHYQKIQAGTEELRDLFGSIMLAKANTFGSDTNPLEDMKIRVADPVFVIFITTSTISSNAWRLLKRSGIIGMDGEMLAAFLSDRQVGLKSSMFSKSAFMAWLDI